MTVIALHPDEKFATPTLMLGLHETKAVGLAKRLGAAAFAANQPRNPALLPGFAEAVNLPYSDPLAVKVYAAYTAGYDAAKGA